MPSDVKHAYPETLSADGLCRTLPQATFEEPRTSRASSVAGQTWGLCSSMSAAPHSLLEGSEISQSMGVQVTKQTRLPLAFSVLRFGSGVPQRRAASAEEAAQCS